VRANTNALDEDRSWSDRLRKGMTNCFLAVHSRGQNICQRDRQRCPAAAKSSEIKTFLMVLAAAFHFYHSNICPKSRRCERHQSQTQRNRGESPGAAQIFQYVASRDVAGLFYPAGGGQALSCASFLIADIAHGPAPRAALLDQRNEVASSDSRPDRVAATLSKDFEATIESALAWLQLALAFLITRRLARLEQCPVYRTCLRQKI
jgi:hypothetical protein